jgi:hypothetical protein
MAVMPWYEQTAEENNIILGNAQDDFLLLKHCRGGSRAKRVIPPPLRNKRYKPSNYLTYNLYLPNLPGN